VSGSPRILFISRAFPPIIGGIEHQNYELHRALAAETGVQLIVNRRGKRFLPLFYLRALFSGLLAAPRHDVILLGDAVLAPLGWLLATLCRKPVCCVVHGLDVTYTNPIYQAIWIRFALVRMNRLFAVGNETLRQAVARGAVADRCRFIANGVDISQGSRSVPGDDSRIRRRDGEFHLLTLGRLEERKGVAWFLREVFPLLGGGVHYWVAGDGPFRSEIESAVAGLPVPDRVTVFGRVTEAEKFTLLQEADLFVQPNIPVPGDIEGFGLVVLEAAAAGLPVVASRLEGLCDAIADGKNGILVTAGDAADFAKCIRGFIADRDEATVFGARARDYTLAHCSWTRVAQRYLEEIRALTAVRDAR
jgi:phosphatidylinositol alpha-1,6-mannosyltransferase